jgi:hypothetical protein
VGAVYAIFEITIWLSADSAAGGGGDVDGGINDWPFGLAGAEDGAESLVRSHATSTTADISNADISVRRRVMSVFLR